MATTVSSGANVNFLAGTSITLLPNFRAAFGSSFVAMISATPPTLSLQSPATGSSMVGTSHLFIFTVAGGGVPNLIQIGFGGSVDPTSGCTLLYSPVGPLFLHGYVII
jgi:hypothetical protein